MDSVNDIHVKNVQKRYYYPISYYHNKNFLSACLHGTCNLETLKLIKVEVFQ